MHTWTADDNVSELILTRTMLIEEDISKYCRIVENKPSLPDDCEISEISWDKLNIPLELIRLSTELVKKNPSKLTYKHWNLY